MELKQLEHFVRVAELGGFTKGANALSLSQPALSRSVRKLEVELRENLLIRNGRGFKLTEAGILLLAHAKGLLEQADKARQEIGDLKGSPTGKVTMGCSAAAGAVRMAKLISAFRKRFPRAELELIEIKGSSIYEWLLMGRLDLGILYNPPPSSSIALAPLRQDKLFLISAASSAGPKPAMKVTAEHLAQYPLILPTAIKNLVKSVVAKSGVKLNTPLQIDGASFILELVNQGEGHTILPLHTVRESSLNKKLQINAIVRPQITRTLTLAYSAQRRLTRLTQETIRLVLEFIKAEAD